MSLISAAQNAINEGKDSFTTPLFENNDAHKNTDTDKDSKSIHHTLGPLATQASPGNHRHEDYEKLVQSLQEENNHLRNEVAGLILRTSSLETLVSNNASQFVDSIAWLVARDNVLQNSIDNLGQADQWLGTMLSNMSNNNTTRFNDIQGILDWHTWWINTHASNHG